MRPLLLCCLSLKRGALCVNWISPFDLLNTTRVIIEKKPGLELLCYLVSMAIQEIEDRRKDLNKSPLPP
jgi:hypothetical protein